jgi:hypothetical protein
LNTPENNADQRFNNILTGSAVPTILVLVLIWVTAAVLLTISVLTQRDFTILKKGDAAPFSTWALTDFSYIDKAKTSAEKAAARKNAPEYLLISNERSRELNDDLDTFLAAARNRAEMELQKQKYVPSSSAPAQMAGKFIHFEELKNRYKVMSVPCLVVNNGSVSFGKKNLSQILDLLQVEQAEIN